jgi:ribosomal protein S18 acetylase RimI-like enzyme
MDYQSLLEKVQSIVISKGYRLEMNMIGEAYVFYIYDNEIMTSNIQIYKSTGTIIVGKTRRKQELEDYDNFNISWISTEPPYRGQGLALLLLIYGICYLKQKYPDINYVTLDDDSDRNDRIEPNLYDSLGFGFRDEIKMDISNANKLKLSGPEKQLLLDNEFIRRSNLELNNRFSKKGGKQKSRKNRAYKKQKSRKNKTYKKRKDRKNRKTKRRL